MKRQRFRFKLVALFLFALFLALILFGAYSILHYGNRWFSSRWNTRISAQSENVTEGDIADRNGVLLAWTDENGDRTWQESREARSAIVHITGDSEGMAANTVESFQARYLYGFDTSLSELGASLIGRGSSKGDTVTLTIDSALCTAITRYFSAHLATAGKNGAAVVMNYRTGEVLAMVSLPNYDPAAITDSDRQSTDTPFFNRVTQGKYTPGSSFKVITAAAALDSFTDPTTATLYCDGALQVGDHAVTDWNNESHGNVTLKQAFSASCNNAFASLALGMGAASLKKTAESFGFNDNFLFRDLVVENSSFPDPENDWQLAWSGAGQSGITASPLHMCMVAAAVANDGVMMEPRLVRTVTTASGGTRLASSAAVYRRAVSQENAAVLKDLMRSVVTGGTGRNAAVSGMTICGKTGSAETTSDGQAVTNGWFIGFCEDEDLPFAVCVLVEDIGDGTGGGATAAPIAADIFRYLKANPDQVTGEDPQVTDWSLQGISQRLQTWIEQAGSFIENLPENVSKLFSGGLQEKAEQLKQSVTEAVTDAVTETVNNAVQGVMDSVLPGEKQ